MADVIIFHFGPFFALLLPPLPLTAQKQKNFKKSPEDIIILYMCTKYHDHIMYCTPPHTHTLNIPKNQFFKETTKMPGDIIVLHIRTANYDQMVR